MCSQGKNSWPLSASETVKTTFPIIFERMHRSSDLRNNPTHKDIFLEVTYLLLLGTGDL